MIFGVGRIWHVSNTFARVDTTLQAFRSHEWLIGQELVRHYEATNTVLGGVLDAAADDGIQIEPLVALSAPGGGPIDDVATNEILEALRSTVSQSNRLDGVLLQLSGAAVATSSPEFDLRLVRELHEALVDVPISLVLDVRANISPALAQLCAVLSITGPEPSISDAGVGSRSLANLREIVASRRHPDLSIHKLPLVVPTSALHTDIPSLDSVWQATSSNEQRQSSGWLQVATGFQQADVTHAGASVVAQGFTDPALLDRSIDVLSESLIEACRHLRIPARNPEEAIHDAMATRSGTSVIVDLGDDPADGAPGDGTTLLWALIDLGVQDAVLASIADPDAVAACVAAGEDSHVELSIGGRRDTRHGYPIDIRGRVKTIANGRFQLDGPLDRGLAINAGSIVLLEIEARHNGHVDVILTERPVETCDPAMFRHLGIDPSSRGIIAVKSVEGARSAFANVAIAIHFVLTPGITTPDPAAFRYQNIPRPMFPIDPI